MEAFYIEDFKKLVKKNNFEISNREDLMELVEGDLLKGQSFEELAERDQQHFYTTLEELSLWKLYSIIKDDLTKAIVFAKESDVEWSDIEERGEYGQILKARGGTYANTYQNRKLGRVGQKFGSKKGESKEKKIELPYGRTVTIPASTEKLKEYYLASFKNRKYHNKEGDKVFKLYFKELKKRGVHFKKDSYELEESNGEKKNPKEKQGKTIKRTPLPKYPSLEEVIPGYKEYKDSYVVADYGDGKKETKEGVSKTGKTKSYLSKLLSKPDAKITIIKKPHGDIVKVNGETAFNLSDKGMYNEGKRKGALNRAYLASKKNTDNHMNEHGVHKGYLSLMKKIRPVHKPYGLLDENGFDQPTSNFTDEERHYLTSLNTVDNPKKGKVPLHNPKGAGEEYILKDGTDTYYVDTQGYNYPRYMTKIDMSEGKGLRR
jgi:hypothetical protein